ncbi:hypothetical protein CDL15_Pgr008797 [Punica granatum]|uniref:Uncharacterized protein n=1 Tax=Punica granatum TaxID=22663 RepID=A0A218VYC6_PUNGR|nr:hypothetical protein CDL15_Pgr008797 [Punica granatum]PKI33759.1 hypothetical protein CRG98_045848 [Punica granatum]
MSKVALRFFGDEQVHVDKLEVARVVGYNRLQGIQSRKMRIDVPCFDLKYGFVEMFDKSIVNLTQEVFSWLALITDLVMARGCERQLTAVRTLFRSPGCTLKIAAARCPSAVKHGGALLLMVMGRLRRWK